jgi:hypothetical protein
MPMQLPKHKPLQERCVKLKALVSGMFGAMQSLFQDKVCECLGCCGARDQPLCFYPVNIP